MPANAAGDKGCAGRVPTRAWTLPIIPDAGLSDNGAPRPPFFTQEFVEVLQSAGCNQPLVREALPDIGNA